MAKKESFFWTSYSDLMTSMFFIMLVLFVLAVALLHRHMDEIDKERKATQEQLRIIEEIEEATQTIDTTYFDYSQEHKKHVLKIEVLFPEFRFELEHIDQYTQVKLIEAGEALAKSIHNITNKYPEVQYILVIEGQASRDNYHENYELSYKRALTLKKLWDKNSINFGNKCEVVIGGNGDGKLSGTGFMREKNERANQRFLIHILPKTSIPKKSIHNHY